MSWKNFVKNHLTFLDGAGAPSSKGERLHDSEIRKRSKLFSYQRHKNTTIVFGKIDYFIVDYFDVTVKQIEEACMIHKHPFTIPDWLFIVDRQVHGVQINTVYACYLDGPAHLTLHNSRRDDEINALLKARGVKVLRFPNYKMGRNFKRIPLCAGDIKANVDVIEEFVIGDLKKLEVCCSS